MQFLQDIKGSASKWINGKKSIIGKFSWQACLPKGYYGRQVLQGSTARRQEGYGAFSYSKSDLPNVIQYIKNQEEHHKREASSKNMKTC